ncbi:hypothetical protein C8R41DRAFT_862102 [Lentinula lateritia]|uniref:Uncharacterized protein n=1 Tax=Lentinula lateritia TaxID=40482 RepID=A0ABQ8VYP3_9AGAR|nr:hypothetical protein C8R41DRAFT_862102 [Lentinula lateritia]
MVGSYGSYLVYFGRFHKVHGGDPSLRLGRYEGRGESSRMEPKFDPNLRADEAEVDARSAKEHVRRQEESQCEMRVGQEWPMLVGPRQVIVPEYAKSLKRIAEVSEVKEKREVKELLNYNSFEKEWEMKERCGDRRLDPSDPSEIPSRQYTSTEASIREAVASKDLTGKTHNLLEVEYPIR